MEEHVDEALKKVISFSQIYDRENLNKLINNLPTMLKDVNVAILHVLTTLMFRGRSDELSNRYANCLKLSMRELYESGKLDLKRGITNSQIKELLKKYDKHVKREIGKSNERDKEMIESYFKYVYPHLQNYGYNPILYIKDNVEKGKIWRTYYCLITRIKWSGQKLVGFLLRDLIDALKYRDNLTEADLIYIFPVDTWVEQVTFMLWGKEFMRKPKRIRRRGRLYLDANEVKYIAITECLERGIHPSDFNKGAWKIGVVAETHGIHLKDALFTMKLI